MTKFQDKGFKPYRKSEESWEQYVQRRDEWNAQLKAEAEAYKAKLQQAPATTLSE